MCPNSIPCAYLLCGHMDHLGLLRSRCESRESSPDRGSSTGSIFGGSTTTGGRSRSMEPSGSSLRSGSFGAGRMAGTAPSFRGGGKTFGDRGSSFGDLPMNLVNTTAALACYMVMTESVSENHINLVSRKMCIEQIANVLKIGPALNRPYPNP